MIPDLSRPGRDELRRLPLVWVADRLGVTFNADQRALCPLHHDTVPSLRLWTSDAGETLWWCDPCNVGGDVLELIRRVRHISFPETLQLAAELAAELPADWTPSPAPVPPPSRGPDDWGREVFVARERAVAQPGILAERTGLASDPITCRLWDEYLRTVWGWGLLADGGVSMPHWTQDGELTGCKVRYPDGGRASLEGSRYDALYGEWLGKPRHAALLCEGETDAAYAGYTAMREGVKVEVYALPSGAGRSPTAANLEFLRGAHIIYLALDPDTVGVAATRSWLEALHDVGLFDVRVCPLPRGLDVRAAHASVRTLLRTARRRLIQPPQLEVDPRSGNTYILKPGDPPERRLIAQWSLEPVAQLAGGEPGFEVEVSTRGGKRTEVIHLTDLATISALTRWANKRSLVFPGTDRDVKVLAEYVAARGAVTPEIFQTQQVGVHAPPRGYEFAGSSVVYPDAYAGKLPWRYAPGVEAADVTKRVYTPTDEPFNWTWLEDFILLSHPEVTHPLLAWLIAAMRRPEVENFPLLFIGGSSGVGKSTLARLALRLAGSRLELDLAASTAHILIRTLAASTSLPVFVDEWTQKSRRDTREAFQGYMPVLYTGGRAERGQADLSALTYRLTAPTIVAGEDTFTLDRERERLIRITPTHAVQNPAALRRVAEAPLERFAFLLHRRLLNLSGLPAFELTVTDRVAHNRRVLQVGWETLLYVLEEESLHDPNVPALPAEPDLSALDREAAEAAEDENVYEIALAEGTALRDGGGLPVVWSDPDGAGTWVRFQALLGALKRQNMDLDLPGRSRAMQDYFTERYGPLRKDRVEVGQHVTKARAYLIPGLDLGDESALATMFKGGSDA